MEPTEFHIDVVSDGQRAVDLLCEASGLSKQRIKHIMTCGAVWITRGGGTARLRRASRTLKLGDTLHLYYNEAVIEEQPLKPTLVADAGSYSVWDKPSGLRSQGSKWGDHCTVVRWAERHLKPERTGFTVHRLDRAASGLIVIAHSKKAAAALARQFRERHVEKRYRATVAGDFSLHTEPLAIDQPLDGKVARSEIRFVSRVANENQSVVDVRIETGRKHQIRRHLAGIGFPIVGDRLYGHAHEGDVDLQLRAVAIAFENPANGTSLSFCVVRPAGRRRSLPRCGFALVSAGPSPRPRVHRRCLIHRASRCWLWPGGFIVLRRRLLILGLRGLRLDRLSPPPSFSPARCVRRFGSP